MTTKNTVELNGKHYDASTGVVVNTSTAVGRTSTQAKNLDGFFRATRTTKAAVPAKIVASPAPTHPRTLPKPTRATAQHTRAHQPEAAKTLMRSAVKRPAPSLKQQTNVQGSLQHKVPSLIVPKQSVQSINPNRIARAANVARSPHIARHAHQSQSVAVSLAHLPVQAAPETPTEAPRPGAPAPQPTNKPVDIFEHAMANASNFVDVQAHRVHFKKKARAHVASMAVGTLALLVIAGFAAYQNTPGLQLKVASVQAGISTHAPNFQAAGFAYNGVKAVDGKLTVGFSGQGGSYQLVQQTTNWSGSDMIQNLSATDASGTPNYTTVQAGSTTVYRFSNSSATWVSDGTWYQVSGTGILTDSQVRSLATNS